MNRILGLSLDTRWKICAAKDLGQVAGTLVVGYFDPLQAAHVRRLEEIRRGSDLLTIVVADPPLPLLPLHARAELVAALACVGRVILAGSKLDETLARLQPAALIDERAADEQRTRDLAAHVASRHARA